MKRQTGFCVVAILVVLCAASVAQAADKPSDGWKVLFNGKNIKGWQQHGGKAVYRVVDKAIVGQSVPNTQNSFLCTKQQFGDFELLFEVKADRRLNSGVQIRSNIKENDRVFGPQVEIAGSPGSSGYIYGEATGRGWLSQDRSKSDAIKNDKWNQFRIV